MAGASLDFVPQERDESDQAYIKRLVGLLNSDKTSIAAARALIKLSGENNTNQASIADAGAIPHLIKLLQSPCESVQALAAQAILNLTYQNEKNIAAIVVEAGAPLVRALVWLYRTDEDTQNQVAFLLGSLASHSLALQKDVQAAVDVPTLVNLIKSRANIDEKKHYIHLLWNLAPANKDLAQVLRLESHELLDQILSKTTPGSRATLKDKDLIEKIKGRITQLVKQKLSHSDPGALSPAEIKILKAARSLKTPDEAFWKKVFKEAIQAPVLTAIRNKPPATCTATEKDFLSHPDKYLKSGGFKAFVKDLEKGTLQVDPDTLEKIMEIASRLMELSRDLSPLDPTKIEAEDSLYQHARTYVDRLKEVRVTAAVTVINPLARGGGGAEATSEQAAASGVSTPVAAPQNTPDAGAIVAALARSGSETPPVPREAVAIRNPFWKYRQEEKGSLEAGVEPPEIDDESKPLLGQEGVRQRKPAPPAASTPPKVVEWNGKRKWNARRFSSVWGASKTASGVELVPLKSKT